MTRKERLDLLKQIEKDIHVCSLESTLLDDAKSCAIHSIIEALEQEPCGDAISRQATLDLIADYDLSMGQVVKGIHALPLVIPQSRIGHWIPRNAFLLQYKCSECGWESEKYNYCPNCGAKMQEVEE